MDNYIKIIQGQTGYFEFQLKNNRNHTLLSSENYTSKSGCINGAYSLILNAKKQSNYILLKNMSKYYFFIKAPNGQILAKSSKFENQDRAKLEMTVIQSIFEKNVEIKEK